MARVIILGCVYLFATVGCSKERADAIQHPPAPADIQPRAGSAESEPGTGPASRYAKPAPSKPATPDVLRLDNPADAEALRVKDPVGQPKSDIDVTTLVPEQLGKPVDLLTDGVEVGKRDAGGNGVRIKVKPRDEGSEIRLKYEFK